MVLKGGDGDGRRRTAEVVFVLVLHLVPSTPALMFPTPQWQHTLNEPYLQTHTHNPCVYIRLRVCPEQYSPSRRVIGAVTSLFYTHKVRSDRLRAIMKLVW